MGIFVVDKQKNLQMVEVVWLSPEHKTFGNIEADFRSISKCDQKVGARSQFFFALSLAKAVSFIELWFLAYRPSAGF